MFVYGLRVLFGSCQGDIKFKGLASELVFFYMVPLIGLLYAGKNHATLNFLNFDIAIGFHHNRFARTSCAPCLK